MLLDIAVDPGHKIRLPLIGGGKFLVQVVGEFYSGTVQFRHATKEGHVIAGMKVTVGLLEGRTAAVSDRRMGQDTSLAMLIEQLSRLRTSEKSCRV